MNKLKRILSIMLAIIICQSLGGCGVDNKISPTPVPRDTSNDTKLSSSMVYANNIANGVQSYFTKPDRSSYTMTNTQIEMIHELEGDSKYITSLKTRDGKVYLNNTMDLFIKNKNGDVFYSSNSVTPGRMNTTRLGYYYYESHIRDLGFTKKDVKIEDEYDISGFVFKIGILIMI